jgi:hypothetical protein
MNSQVQERRPWSRRILIWVSLLIIVLGAAGWAYEQITEVAIAKKNPIGAGPIPASDPAFLIQGFATSKPNRADTTCRPVITWWRKRFWVDSITSTDWRSRPLDSVEEHWG